MKGILSDHDIEGHVNILMSILESDYWRDLWNSENLTLFTLEDLALPDTTEDSVIWHVCQKEQIVLLTGNRNKDGPDSLEATILKFNSPNSLPVFTLADVERIQRSGAYAKKVVERLAGVQK